MLSEFLIPVLAAALIASRFLLWRFARASKTLAAEKSNLEAEKAALAAEKNALAASLSMAEKLLGEEKSATGSLRAQNAALLEKNASLEALREADAAKNAEFEAFAAKVFESARSKFESSNKTQLDLILSPLKDDINRFRKRVDEINLNGDVRGAKMEEQVKSIREMGMRLGDEAKMLSKALRQNKTAGNWGEMSLEKILEDCGLKEGVNFLREDSHSAGASENKTRLRPDVVVKMPDSKNFIIDSKVSLVHFMAYANAEDEAARAKALKQFEASVKTHIKELSEKSYENIENLKNPDFTMMFIPIEGAFALAVSEIPDILEYAYARKISLASPATMFAVLRTVEAVWNMERGNKNALEIAEYGGKIYDKLCVFLEKFVKIESSIKSLQNAYDEAMLTLKSGKGNVVGIAEKLRLMGAKAKRKNEILTAEDVEDE